MSIAKDVEMKDPEGGNFAGQLGRVLRENIRDYGMFIALFVIWIAFYVLTDGIFLSARNISNLLNQFGYIAVLGIGMTLVIVIRHIDLSVGFLAGFLGALAAIALRFWEWPVWLVIPSVLIVGALLGLIPGFLVARLGIPAFVATLAGFLIYRGAILVVTESTGTIIISNDAFNAIGNGFIPDIPIALIPGKHLLTLLIGALAIILYIYNEIKGRRTKMTYEFEVLPNNIFILKLLLVSLLIGAMTWILASYNGLSWTVVVMLIVVGIWHFVTTQTVLGRHIYAVGGNPEAGRTQRRQRQAHHLPHFQPDGLAGGAVGHAVRLAPAIGDPDGGHTVRAGRHRCGVCRRRVGRRRRGARHRRGHRRPGHGLAHQRHEPDGHRHLLPVHRPRHRPGPGRHLRRGHAQPVRRVTSDG